MIYLSIGGYSSQRSGNNGTRETHQAYSRYRWEYRGQRQHCTQNINERNRTSATDQELHAIKEPHRESPGQFNQFDYGH